MSTKIQGGKRITGTALYKPEFNTYKETSNEVGMRYRNTHGGNDWLEIKYESKHDRYVGEKYIDGKQAGTAFGRGWKMFFMHFTALGVMDGETCLLKEEPAEDSK